MPSNYFIESFIFELNKIANQQAVQMSQAAGVSPAQSQQMAYPQGVASAGASTGSPVSTNTGMAAYAKGGIVRKPTKALIGEDGPEAIIPLTKKKRARMLAKQILKETEKNRK